MSVHAHLKRKLKESTDAQSVNQIDAKVKSAYKYFGVSRPQYLNLCELIEQRHWDLVKEDIS